MSHGSALAAPITGQLYDASSGQPVRGVALSLVYDDEDPTSPGQPVPERDVGPGQQGQITGRDGLYRFDVSGGRRYRLVLDTSQTSFVAPSTRIPPRPGLAPLGDVVSTPTPAAPDRQDADRSYYLRFDLPGANDRVRNNHIAVDRVGELITLDKRADRSTAAAGELVWFTVTVANGSAQDLTGAAGRRVYILDTPARGLALARGQAVARVHDGASLRTLRAGVDFEDKHEAPGSRRLVRFGPFDLPAGASLVLQYPVTVGLDVRPGAYDNRAVLVDGGGVALSPEALARVRVTADADLDTGLVLGRVFCDQDRDGRRDASEAGVMGARIYLDTGSYAITDSEGAYHFSRVRAGTRLVKIDVATLAGGTVHGPAERLLRLSRGLSGRVDFAATCELVPVALGAATRPAASRSSGPAGPDAAARPGAPAQAESIELRGDVAAMQVSMAGKKAVLPAATLALDVPAAGSAGTARNLTAVPAGGYAEAARPRWRLGWSAPAGIRIERWSLRIGKLARDGAITPVRTIEGGNGGAGAASTLPAEVAWDGLDQNGAPAQPGGLYVAQLAVAGNARGAEAASARLVFGIAVGGPRELVWRGPLFAGSAAVPTATPALSAHVQELAAQLGPDDRVEILVHADGTGERLRALVDTQKQAKIVGSLLTGAGVAAERVAARGRGSLEPVQPATSPAGREANRRVIIKITPGAEQVIPETAVGAGQVSQVLINREPVALTGQSFVARVKATSTVLVSLTAADGRYARVELATGLAPGAAPARSPETEADRGQASSATGTVEVRGDLAGGTVHVAGREVLRGLLAVDARLTAAEVTIEQHGQTLALAAPLTFALSFPGAQAVRSWTLSITEVSGEADGNAVVHRAGGNGALPGSHAWDGNADGKLALVPGRRYAYQLAITTGDGSRGMSPVRHFLASQGAPRIALRGALFTPAGQPSAELQTQLTALAAHARTTAGARYRIELAIAAQGGSAVTARLGLAARTAAVKKALTSMGVEPARYELRTSPGQGTDDTLAIETELPESPVQPEPAAQPGRVVIGEVEHALAGTGFRVEVPAGQPIALDITSPAGHRAVLAVAAPAQPPGSPAASQDTPDRMAQPAGAGTVVHLPRAGTVLRSRTLAITGRTQPGTRILAMQPHGAQSQPKDAAQPKPHHAAKDAPALPLDLTSPATADSGVQAFAVQADGRFAGLITLPPGRSVLELRAVTPDGQVSSLAWPVTVDDQRLFVMALAEVAAQTAHTSVERATDGRTLSAGLSADSANLADLADLNGLDDTSSVRIGPVRLHGRLALYVKGTLSAGKLAPRVDVTAHVDTARKPGTGAFFEQLTDPRTSAPVYGDSADEVRDANTRGRMYLHVDAGHASATLGSVHTDLGSGELFRYDRTVDGALVRVDRAADTHRIEVRAFGTGSTSELRQDVNWYRATGGTLYYLRNGHVVEGSERVRVIVRDSASGVAVSERVLEQGRDYRIDYASGRVMLAEPLASTQQTRWIVDSLEASTAPSLGDPVFLEVRYEHTDPAGAAEHAGGVHGRVTVGQVAAGAGVVAENRTSGNYTLWGADAAVRVGASSRMGFEIAGSRRREAEGVLSMDGGLRFADVHGGLVEVDPDAMHLGWKLTADWHGGDLVGQPWAQRTRLQVLAQQLDRGFSAGDAVLEQGRFKLGALLTHALSEHDSVLVRHETQHARLPRVGPTQAELDTNPDPLALDEHAAHRTAVQWSAVRGRWQHRVEAGHQYLNTDAVLSNGEPTLHAQRLGVGAATALAHGPRLTLRASQQAVVDLGDADPRLDPIAPPAGMPADPALRRDSEPFAGLTTNLGADWALTETAALSADWYQRWNGDNAGQIGLRSALSETGAMYVRQRLGATSGRAAATTVIGAEDRTISGNGRSYGEYQLENGVHGQRNQAVLGLGHGWQVAPGARLALGFEHQHVLGGALADGTPLGTSTREVIHGGGEYRYLDRLQAAARMEVRIDDSTASALALADQRPVVAPGSLADHGGAVLGAAAVLPPGHRLQVVLGAGMDWRWTPGHTMLGRAYLAHTTAEVEGSSYTEAQSLELTTGWAYRPPAHAWLDLIARYSHLRDLRPHAPDSGSPGSPSPPSSEDLWAARSHVLALVPLVDLPHRLGLSGKLAWKHTTSASAPSTGDSGDNGPEVTSQALLWLVRLGYRLYGRWDAGFELRGLHLSKPARAHESRLGTLVEIGYQIQRHIRLGIGYNMSRFSDDELGDLERDSHGAFVRVTGHY